MTDLWFVDTNVLVYRLDASEADKQPVARLSVQVLHEFYDSEDLQDGAEFAGIEVVDPFSRKPEAMGLG